MPAARATRTSSKNSSCARTKQMADAMMITTIAALLPRCC